MGGLAGVRGLATPLQQTKIPREKQASPFPTGGAMADKLTFHVTARRIDAHASEASTKDASLTLDTDLGGRRDAFNPAELLLAALAACMIKGIERVTPMLRFELRGISVELHGVRQDVPPRMERIDYVLTVDTDESDQRLALLHENVKKYGTVFNTVAPGTNLSGAIRRM